MTWLNDNDPGNTAADRLTGELPDAGVPCREAQPPLETCNPNEALVKYREALQKAMKTIESGVWQMALAQWSPDQEEFQQDSAAYAVDGQDEQLLRL